MVSVPNAKKDLRISGTMRCPWLVRKTQRERFGTTSGMAEYPWCRKLQTRPSYDTCNGCTYKYELLDEDELPLKPKLIRMANEIGRSDSFRRDE